MNRLLLAMLIGAAPFLWLACAVQGNPFEKAKSSPENAVIYVYRPYHYGSSLLKPSVTCGEETARIGPGGYHAFVVPKGHTVCTVETETVDAVEIFAEPRAYYVREEFGWGTLTGHPHLNPVDNDRAQSEIQTCCVQESLDSK